MVPQYWWREKEEGEGINTVIVSERGRSGELIPLPLSNPFHTRLVLLPVSLKRDRGRWRGQMEKEREVKWHGQKKGNKEKELFN